jgi:hypothetical protein
MAASYNRSVEEMGNLVDEEKRGGKQGLKAKEK